MWDGVVFILWAETLGEGEVDGTIYQGRNSFTMASGHVQSYNWCESRDIPHSHWIGINWKWHWQLSMLIASLFKLQLTLKHGQRNVCSYIAVCLRLARPKFVISPGIEAEPPGLSGAWAGRRDLGHNEGGHPDNSDCDTNSFITTSTSIAGGKKSFLFSYSFCSSSWFWTCFTNRTAPGL